ncbi:hypothetical protein [Sporomusa sphaeroides]|uniref:Uncharacterized protein n=1 Tax=Sporomusa sphaeroides DSM 2875 TaxID=1337886 RepID=A0ABP2CA79_9FIRM|nr:hypothetical protein [Sporomusa sphaeroides]OLS54423.1 hypothetical protein SPSPH_45050 [Sporomusa sphaeroides DSM 2875]CVK20666.1 hypothetical protein SSPH_03334 [Sporomusa sphaeroides DSM 2875]
MKIINTQVTELNQDNYSGILRCDHFILEFTKYQGRKLSDYSIEERAAISDLIKESILNMSPIPDALYYDEFAIHAQWFFPAPLFIENEAELDKFEKNLTDFARTNSVSQCKPPTICSQEEQLERQLVRSYDFYKNLGVHLVWGEIPGQ